MSKRGHLCLYWREIVSEHLKNHCYSYKLDLLYPIKGDYWVNIQKEILILHEEKFKKLYQSWNPAHIDWNTWSDALSTVKAVYLRNEHIGTAMKRLEKIYTVKEIVSCKFGKALRVNHNWVFVINNTF